jgi:creatinine amidohydrolase/Fe(II)-dependent formamide hydrolase-like protein
MMTWPEVKAAMESGKTTALFYTGGTEQRGPQNVNGGHTLMARATVKAIALPVLPFSPTGMSADIPGSFNLSAEVLGRVLEELAEDGVTNGFKTVILMGDHGGGQPNAYASVAKKLDEKYAPRGIHVYYVDEVYGKRQEDFDAYLKAHGYPISSHAGIPDTSEMIYLGEHLGWVRMSELPNAVGDTTPRGAPRDPNRPRVNNGISGDARRSSAELGKMEFDMKIDYAVRQIKALTGGK